MIATQHPDLTAVEALTIATRNLYPVGLRKWGMIITVTNDPTPANNVGRVLKYNQASTDKSDNNNWVAATITGGTASGSSNEIQKNDGAGGFSGSGEINSAAQQYDVDSTKTRYRRKNLEEHTSILTGSSIVVAAADWVDGEAVTIKAIWSAKDDSANTGAGGLFVSTWTKAGGVIQKVFDNDTIQGSDTGDTFAVSTNTAGNDIVIEITNDPSAASNFSVAWHAELIFRKI